MLAAVLVPLDDHDAATSRPVVPRLATPAAIPAPVAALVGAAGQGAFGEGPEVEARRRRVRDVLDGDVLAGLAAFGGLGRRGAVVDLCPQVLAGQLIGRLVAHDVSSAGTLGGDVRLCACGWLLGVCRTGQRGGQ